MKNFYLNTSKVIKAAQLRPSFAKAIMLFSIILLFSVNLLAQAPVISYSSPHTYVQGTAITTLSPTSSGGTVAAPAYSTVATSLGTFTNPQGMVTDAAGNIYFADQSTNGVYKIPAGGGTATSIGTGFNRPFSVAVDATGNVYVADYNSSTIKEILAAGGSTIVVASGFNGITGVAIDVFGNLYAADNGAGTVDKVYAGGSVPVVIVSGLSQPYFITTDATGNAYFSDYGNNLVKEIPVGSNTPVVLGSGFANPQGVAVDAAGNVFVTDRGNNAIKEILAGGSTTLVIDPSVTTPVGVALDASGNIFYSEVNTSTVDQIKPVGGYYSGLLPAGLLLNETTGAVTGTPTGTNTAASYVVTAYNSLGSGKSGALSLTVNAAAITLSYSSPQTFTQGTAVTVSPTSTAVAAPVYSNTAISLGTGFSTAQGVAVDVAGNVYVVDQGNNAIKKIPVGGGTPVSIGTGFNRPWGVAVDLAGNVYVADYNSNTLKEILASNGTTVTVATGFSGITGVAIDAAGNIFIADYSAGTVDEIYAGGSSFFVLQSGFNQPYSVAVDVAENVYVTDYGNNQMKEIPAGGGTPVVIGSGFSLPYAVAVDVAGNVYVADRGNNAVKEIPAGNGSPIALCQGFRAPTGLAISNAGSLYVDNGSADVAEIKLAGGYYVSPALPLGLSLKTTTGVISGTPTVANAAANYTVNAYNSFGDIKSATVNIKVNAAPATLAYATPKTYVAGTAITALSPTISGGTVAARTYNIEGTSVATGLGLPYTPAVDAAGNVYVADQNNNLIKKFPAGGGAPVSIGIGFNRPFGVAVDATGNVFVADYNSDDIKEIRASDGSTVVVSGGFSGVIGVAVDAAGNIYAADNGAGTVDEIFAGGNSFVVLASGLNQPYSCALDPSGNIYVSDYLNNAIKKIPAGGGTPVTVGSGFSAPDGVAVDNEGNIFIADKGNNELKEILVGGTTPIILASGFKAPTGVAVDGAGNIYVSHAGSDVVELKPAGGYSVGQLLPKGLTFNSNTGTISGTPIAVTAATNYTITGYFEYGAVKSAVLNLTTSLPPLPTISYADPVNFIRVVPTTVLPASANVAAPAYSGVVTTYATGFSQPYGVAVDASGNVFVVNQGNNTVTKVPAGGGTPVTIGSGFNRPFGAAVDVAGNVYVADYNSGRILEIPLGTGTTVTTVVSGFSDITGVAVDAAGNLYAADYGSGAVYKIAAGTSTKVSIGTGFANPYGVTVDPAGNVFVADYGANLIDEILASDGTTVGLGTGYLHPEAVAADNAGNVYIADNGNKAVKEIVAGADTAITLSTSFSAPAGITVDGAGNLFVADAAMNIVREINPAGGYFITPSLPTGLSFSTQTGAISGTPTLVTPAANYTVTGYNAFSGLKAATVNLQVLPNANLSALNISKGTLTPVFAAGTTSYIDTVTNGTTTVFVTPTLSDPAATVTVNGTAVASGSASANIALAVGNNTITTVVTAIDGTTKNTYTVNVLRPSNNAALSNLITSGGSISPAFAATTFSYTESVPNVTSQITVTPTLADLTATVTVNGTTVTSGTASAAINLNVGANTLTTVVTAQDGVTKDTYTITVTRSLPAIATLSGLTISNGTLTPAFATATTSYTDVAHSVSSIAIRATTTDPLATETINGTAVPEGTVSPYIPLNAGVNNISVVITAQDGVTQDTYTIAVTRLPEVATLSKLTISSGTLTPAFASGTTSYTDVAHAVSSIAFRATTTDALATETINGTAVPEGTVSPYIPLNVGSNNITIVVTAQDGVTTDTYTIAVTRLPEVATLSKLTVSSGTLSPAFATGTTSYTDVAHSVSSIAFRATTTDALATETINGTAVPEGTVSPYIPLNVGSNNITIVVTAQDGVTTDSYTVAVTRLPEVATLSKLTVSSGTLSPAFATGTTSYTDVAHSVSSIAFRATTTDALATETINGTAVPEGTVSPFMPLNVGSNNITIVVTAQDGVTMDTYTIAVTRLPEVATLSKLTVSSGTLSPAFASGTTSYTDVAHAVSSIAFRATTTDALATETINGTAVPEGTVSSYVPLNAGVNNISIVVTAQDGVTTDTYTIAVTRLPEVATLSKLTTSSGTLSPAFAAATTSYTDVAHAVSSIAFRATTTDALATETINGTAVPEGTVSPYFPLSVGSNTITIIVTAQDGVTTDTYTIAVTRLPEIATLSGLTISSGTLSPAFATATTSYTDNVVNTVSSIAFRATTTDASATETINGTAVPEGTVSPYFPLNVGANTITIIVTAQDGVTTETYTIAVTRAAPPGANIVYEPISVETTTEAPQLANDGIMVHQGVSPNGDGIDDFLQIDNITNYPDNRLAIMNRNGMLVYETKGYDNASKVFDGHSNKNGAMQLPGTYFYSLDYIVNGIIKHKTGFLVLKY
jgi:gliding motility-associated-like protein